jgi:MFS family permease
MNNKSIFQFLPQLPRNVFILGMVSLLNDAASEMIYPLLPLFLTTVLGASPAALGLIEGVAESSVAFFKLLSGYWSDWVKKRKGWIVGGYFISNTIRPLISLAQSWPFIFMLRFFDRMGKGFRTSPRDALIADSMNGKNLGMAYGFHRAMDHSGAVIGPLIASLLLLLWNNNLRAVFLASIIPGALSILLILIFVKDHPLPVTSAPPEHFHPKTAWKTVPSTYKSFLVIVFIFTLSAASDAFLILKAKAAGVPVVYIPLLWSGFHLVKVFVAIPGGKISDRIGRRKTILFGWIVYGLVYAGFGMASGALSVCLLFGVYGFYFGLTEGAERALVAEMAPAHLRGSAFGLLYLVEGISALFASVIFGFLWVKAGEQTAFFFASGLALFASVLLFFHKKKSPRLHQA